MPRRHLAAVKTKKNPFPATIHVARVHDGEEYVFIVSDVDEDAEDGALIAVYQLVEVRRVEVEKRLVPVR